jgi:hypothetical protein
MRHANDVVMFERESHILVWSCQTGEVYRIQKEAQDAVLPELPRPPEKEREAESRLL